MVATKLSAKRFIAELEGRRSSEEYIDMPPGEIERLLESELHEVRAGAMSIMDKQARHKKTPEERRRER